MLNKLGVICAVIFLLTGAFLLYGPASGPDPNQTGRILVGATLVSVSLVIILFVVKDWWHWRKHYKRIANPDHEWMPQEEPRRRVV
jgi:hypothetical protein